jgi:hypothetical protein
MKPRAPNLGTGEGPFGGPLSRVPLAARIALLVGVVVGLFASILLSNASDDLSMAALWFGVGGGVVVAAVLWIRASRRSGRGAAGRDRPETGDSAR